MKKKNKYINMSSKKLKTKVIYPCFFHKCTHCEYETKSKDIMRLHLRVSHNINKNRLDLCNSEKFCDSFVCANCRKFFPSENSLEYHKTTCKHY